jgi:hypothetical protein
MSEADNPDSIPLALLARCIDPAAQVTQVTALDIEPGMSGTSVRSSNKGESMTMQDARTRYACRPR